MARVLVTGSAGFIGSHLVDRLLAEGFEVVGLDNFDPFYPAEVKRRNMAGHLGASRFRLIQADLREAASLEGARASYDAIVHLAAKAGVRPSVQDPGAFLRTNVEGTLNLLEAARRWGVSHFVFASSSSVYGLNPKVPWSEADPVLMPASPYAATKAAGELMGHVYAHLHGIRFVGLRLFTVYGPRQRPDLAIHKFGRLILEGKPVTLFGDGSTRRDYTFVADTVRGLRAALDYKASRYEIFNLACHRPVLLSEMVEALAKALGKPLRIERAATQPGDVDQTWGDISKARQLLGYAPGVEFADGVRAFADWLSAEVAAGR